MVNQPRRRPWLAGLVKMVRQGLNLAEQRVVCIITGAGLKDPDLAVSSISAHTQEIEPNIESLEAAALTPLT